MSNDLTNNNNNPLSPFSKKNCIPYKSFCFMYHQKKNLFYVCNDLMKNIIKLKNIEYKK